MKDKCEWKTGQGCVDRVQGEEPSSMPSINISELPSVLNPVQGQEPLHAIVLDDSKITNSVNAILCDDQKKKKVEKPFKCKTLKNNQRRRKNRGKTCFRNQDGTLNQGAEGCCDELKDKCEWKTGQGCVDRVQGEEPSSMPSINISELPSVLGNPFDDQKDSKVRNAILCDEQKKKKVEKPFKCKTLKNNQRRRKNRGKTCFRNQNGRFNQGAEGCCDELKDKCEWKTGQGCVDRVQSQKPSESDTESGSSTEYEDDLESTSSTRVEMDDDLNNIILADAKNNYDFSCIRKHLNVNDGHEFNSFKAMRYQEFTYEDIARNNCSLDMKTKIGWFMSRKMKGRQAIWDGRSNLYTTQFEQFDNHNLPESWLNCLPPIPLIGVIQELTCGSIFQVFDIGSKYHSIAPFETRLKRLEEIVGRVHQKNPECPIQLVRHIKASSVEDIMDHWKLVSQDGEGLILTDPSAVYDSNVERSPSRIFLRGKPFLDSKMKNNVQNDMLSNFFDDIRTVLSRERKSPPSPKKNKVSIDDDVLPIVSDIKTVLSRERESPPSPMKKSTHVTPKKKSPSPSVNNNKNDIWFYSKSKVDELSLAGDKNFRKYLSNFQDIKTGLTWKGKKFPNVEHAFHWEKWQRTNHPELASLYEINDEDGKSWFQRNHCEKANAKAKQFSGRSSMTEKGATLNVERWNCERINVNKQLLEARYEQDDKFANMIKEAKTKGYRLLHWERGNSKNHPFWGITEFKNGEHKGKRVGQNKLGEQLMQLYHYTPKEQDTKQLQTLLYEYDGSEDYTIGNVEQIADDLADSIAEVRANRPTITCYIPDSMSMLEPMWSVSFNFNDSEINITIENQKNIEQSLTDISKIMCSTLNIEKDVQTILNETHGVTWDADDNDITLYVESSFQLDQEIKEDYENRSDFVKDVKTFLDRKKKMIH